MNYLAINGRVSEDFNASIGFGRSSNRPRIFLGLIFLRSLIDFKIPLQLSQITQPSSGFYVFIAKLDIYRYYDLYSLSIGFYVRIIET
jgi:hypothetical protein